MPWRCLVWPVSDVAAVLDPEDSNLHRVQDATSSSRPVLLVDQPANEIHSAKSTGRRVAICSGFVVGGVCGVACEAWIFLKRSQGHADTCVSEHDPAPVPRVRLEPTGNGTEIEDCSASAGVSEGTVPPDVTRDLREVIQSWGYTVQVFS